MKVNLLVLFGLAFLTLWFPNTLESEEISIHGFISQGYLKSDKNNYLAGSEDGSFQFNEMGINFSTQALEDLRIGCQFFARDLGDIGNDDIVINWAYGEYAWKNWLGLRAGLVKGILGLYNDIRDFDSLRTCIFLPASVYNEWFRDGINNLKGLELFGFVPIGAAGMLEYQFQVGQTQVATNSGTAKLIMTLTENLKQINKIEAGNVYVGNVRWLTPIDGLRIGSAYVRSDSLWEGTISLNNTLEFPIRYDSSVIEYMTISVEYIFKNFIFSAENYRTKAKNTIYIPGLAPFRADNDSKKSFYVNLTYRFSGWFEAGCYYSKYINSQITSEDDFVSASENELEEFCISLRFDIHPNWLLKLEPHLMNGKFGVDPDSNGKKYKEWMFYSAKVSYAF